MTTSIADQTALAACPDWCGAHLDGTTHISVDQIVTTSSPDGFELGQVYISLELADGSSTAAVRLSGAADTPMLPMQAITAGYRLIAAGLAALGGAR